MLVSGRVSLKPEMSDEQREPNPYDIPLNPDWFIGILIMAYYDF